jgi:uncharacterized protein (DUF1810 family)
MTADDRFDLQRFVTAQDPVFETVLAELRAGRKQTLDVVRLSSTGRSREILDSAGQDRAAAAAEAWLLARIGKNRRAPSTDIADAASNKPFVPERLAG